MLNRLKLGGRLMSSFMTVAAVLLAVGLAGYFGLNRVTDRTRTVIESFPLIGAAKELKSLVVKDRRLIPGMIAAADSKALADIWEEHDRTVKEFDVYINGILQGGDSGDGRIYRARDQKLRRIAAEADDFHNNFLQPAVGRVHNAAKQVLENKAVLDRAMSDMEKSFDQAMKLAEELEGAIKARIRTERAAGGSTERILEVESTWTDMAMEMKTTLAMSRIALEEFVQGMEADALADIEKEYRAAAGEFDGWITALLQGGQTDEGVVARVDDPDLRRMIERIKQVNDKGFHSAAERLMTLQKETIRVSRVMIAADREADRIGAKMIALLGEVVAGARRTIASAVTDAERISLDYKLVSAGGVALGFVLAVILGLISARSVTRPLITLAELIGRTAEGDFTARVERRYTQRADEIGDMARDVDRMNRELSTVMSSVSDASASVRTSSEEMSVGNNSLSDRVQQQASSNEETAATIEEMASSIKQNANNAARANELAANTSRAAVQGGEVVNKAIAAMGLVSESSRKINDIIDVVNEIAFQTNLLALNANVEAARAGAAGRGFAVVAGEVRNLAQRSADASKEIQGLIKESVARVDEGNRLVDESGQTLQDIIGNIDRLAEAISEISSSSQEQSNAIGQINTAVVELDDITQQNAALVEQMAASSTGMASEADRLARLMGRFRFNSRDDRRIEPTRVLPAPPAPGEQGEDIP